MKAVILDIEGTVCPISFVKDELFPFFLRELPAKLEKYAFPLTSEDVHKDDILEILVQFPSEVRTSQNALLGHINDLVSRDIKDRVLKQLQGFIWEQGYTTGSILAPLFPDAIECLPKWQKEGLKVYIYSSGSIKAQKLLFANVKTNAGKIDLNGIISGYYDTTNAGKKTEASSYQFILDDINIDPKECLFLSDNPLEVKAALATGMESIIVVKPGNYPLDSSCDDLKKCEDLSTLDL